MPQKRSKQKSSKKKSKDRGASNNTAASAAAAAAEVVPSSTPNLGDDDDVLAWIANSGGDTPPQVIRNEEAYQASTNTAVQAVLHPDDNVEQVLVWIETHPTISPSRLAKRLPHTAQMLRDGETSSEAVATVLYNHLSDRSETKTRDVPPVLEISHLLRTISTKITLRVCSEEPLLSSMVVDMHYRLRRAVREAAKTDEWRALAPVALTRAVKHAFDETCDAWEGRLDARLFQGRPTGTFRESCSLLGVPLEEFATLLPTLLPADQYEDNIRAIFYNSLVWGANRMDDDIVKVRLSQDLYKAACGITQGADKSSDVCWECSTLLESPQTCSRCKVATYCGKECQLQAWKRGHKSMCAILLAKHDRYRASLDALDQVHALDEILRFQFVDYKWLAILHTTASVFVGESFAEELGEPSLKYFYKNLVRVARRKWWIFSEHNTATDAEECNTISESFHDLVAVCLSFDYFGYAARNGIEKPPQVTAFFEKAMTKVTESFGSEMTAAHFLAVYEERGDIVLNTEVGRDKVRKTARRSVLDHLRQHFHQAS